MADVYGMMFLHQSKDLDCNFDELVETLNNYQWNSSMNRWVKRVVDGKQFIEMDCLGLEQVQHPTVFPQKLKGILFEDADGSIHFTEKPSQDEIDYALNHFYEDTTLESIACDISQKITKGHLEISSESNENHRYFCSGSLFIHSDRKAKRIFKTREDGCNKDFEEEFDG